MKLYRLSFWALLASLLFAWNTGMAQVATPDTSHVDSSALAQQLILQQKQQALIDSMVRAKLNEELSNLNDDSKRKRELEAQLAQLHAEDSLRKAEQASRIAALKLKSPGFPVAPFGDTLFFIYTKIGSFHAQERADLISKHIKTLYQTNDFEVDSLHRAATDNGFEILYGPDKVILSVTELDAAWHETSPDLLSQQYLGTIKTAISSEIEQNGLLNWLRRIGLVLLILGSVAGLIWLIRMVFRKAELYLHKSKEKLLNGIKIRNFQLLKPEDQLRLAIRLMRLARIATIIVAIYLALPLLFSVFPDTKIYANTLIGWVLSPAKKALHGLVAYLPNLFTIGVTFMLVRYAIKGVHYLASELEQGHYTLPGFHSDWAKPTFNIVKFVMYAFMLVIIFPYLPGSDSPAFQGVSVFLGILLSLGSSSAITNIIAGLVITYMRPFKLGDRVKIGEVTGDVIEKTMLVTRIRTIKNEDITVPNSTVLNSHTINYSANCPDLGLILNTTVTIGYDVPWRKMQETLIKAAMRTEGILKEPKPFVLQTSLDDFYVSYQLNAYTRDASRQAVLYSNLHQNIQDCCNEADIEILSPHYRAMRDGNMVTIPASYLPPDYQAPSFRVEYPTRKDNQDPQA